LKTFPARAIPAVLFRTFVVVSIVKFMLTLRVIGVYMMTTWFDGIPLLILEAARIDGLGIWGILFRIMVPVSWPMLSTVSIIVLLSMWNEFTFSLLLLQEPAKRTITLGVAMLKGEHGLPVPKLSAAIIVTMLIPLVFYLVLQKKILLGTTSGSIKE